jgi:ECF sigma factor
VYDEPRKLAGAQALRVSVGTVEREWRFLRAWLREEPGDAS